MTDQPNDWNKLDEELKIIKQTAHHEGYNKAIEDMGRAKDDISKGENKLREQVKVWHQILHDVRQAWSAMSGEPVMTPDPVKTHKYRAMFGQNVTYQPFYHNMPVDMDAFLEAANEVIKLGADFALLLDTFDKDPLVKASWDRVLVAMKMTDTGTGR